MAPYQADTACYHTTGAQTVTFLDEQDRQMRPLALAFLGRGKESHQAYRQMDTVQPGSDMCPRRRGEQVRGPDWAAA